jgi:hypothetical protein
MSDTDSDPALFMAVGEQAASTSTIAARSDSKCNVLFDKKTFNSWSDALSGAREIVNKNKDDMATLWYRTTIIHEGDGSFSLRCATCHKAFSMRGQPRLSFLASSPRASPRRCRVLLRAWLCSANRMNP